MELFLNSAWALMAILIAGLWVCLDRRAHADRRLSIVALAMLIVILFPVISVSDDLWSLQNPAETNTYERRHHLSASPHSIHPAISALPVPATAEVTVGFLGLVAPLSHAPLNLKNPALSPIQNRPPPSA